MKNDNSNYDLEMIGKHIGQLDEAAYILEDTRVLSKKAIHQAQFYISKVNYEYDKEMVTITREYDSLSMSGKYLILKKVYGEQFKNHYRYDTINMKSQTMLIDVKSVKNNN